jgi:hypothetical protein
MLLVAWWIESPERVEPYRRVLRRLEFSGAEDSSGLVGLDLAYVSCVGIMTFHCRRAGVIIPPPTQFSPALLLRPTYLEMEDAVRQVSCLYLVA